MAASTVDLSVVIPAYNEASRLGDTLSRVLAYLERRGRSFEVLVVDDGSADNTVAVAQEFSHRGVWVLELARNRGKGAALRHGVVASSGAMVLLSDADLSTPIQVPGEDELARLAESHNRLAADLDRRDREVAAMNDAISDVSVRDGVAFLLARAAADAKRVFGLPEARLLLGNPDDFPVEEVVPGEMRPLRAVLRSGDDAIGVLVGRLPPLRPWARADQDLLELYASEIAVAIRNAELYERVEAQNAQLLELDAAKDDFLRGVSHNLQTPLTSIRAHADQLTLRQKDSWRSEGIGDFLQGKYRPGLSSQPDKTRG